MCSCSGPGQTVLHSRVSVLVCAWVARTKDHRLVPKTDIDFLIVLKARGQDQGARRIDFW